jgi:hypothetical protein
MLVERLLWACVAHDYALHEVKKATVLARRLCTTTEGQEALSEVQLTIADELERRRQEDDDSDSAA